MNAEGSLGFCGELQPAVRQMISCDRPHHLRWQSVCELVASSGIGPLQYRALWDECWQDWDESAHGPRILWTPTQSLLDESNVYRWMTELGLHSYYEFHEWTVTRRSEFWEQAARRLGIVFSLPATSTIDTTAGVPAATWFPGARLNIVDSCFQSHPDDVAIVAMRPGDPLRKTTYRELRALVNRISNSIVAAGHKPGDALAVVLPMTELSVAIYLGIVQAGCVVVSIADSFASPEIASRLRIARAAAVFTYDVQQRSGKTLPLYQRVAEATQLPIIAIADGTDLQFILRSQDISWHDFLSDVDDFTSVVCGAEETINILFSSGTTGDPKAIPWTHLTPLRCAIDGYCHQDIHPQHVCAWPTNLGWMMGPWLIFASLINRATIALYEDAPLGEGFGRFVEQAGVNMLGVVPTIVKAWKTSGCMEPFDWSAIHVFSSTGESSQRDDMFYLSSLAKMRPVIEYCGGTEIGGGYVTSVVALPNAPATFNTPAVGLDFVLLDSRNEVADEGEVFLIPPSIGLSSRLLIRDHHATYYGETPRVAGLPTLRRHGDHFRRVSGAAHGVEGLRFYSAGGRVDDTMNLGGIKISSAEIERVLNRVDGLRETAAVAISTDGGPDRLVVFAVAERSDPPVADEVLQEMNRRLRSELNPLFKAQQVHFVDAMPRTASNKLMRRELRSRLARD